MAKIPIKDNVVFILKARGITQGELAEKLGVSRQNMHHLLNGNITLDRLADIAEALHTLPSELISDPPLEKRKTFIQKSEPTTSTITCPACGKVIKLTAEE